MEYYATSLSLSVVVSTELKKEWGNMNISLKICHATKIEQVVEIVNNGTRADVLPEFEFTPEQLAGQYAFEAVQESEYEHSDQNHEAHLEILEQHGGKFDSFEALKHAKQLAS
jgi:sulfur carrier protein ThiS